MTACDGINLVGHLRKCENEKRLIIAMHGWRSSWAADFGAISNFWYANGCSVLYAEQRGQGESGGEYMGFGLTERYDCIEWVKWANENGYADIPIYLCGISMGASTVLMAAGLELLENVHGIMADCGYTSPPAIWKHVVEENLHMPFDGIKSAVANDICKKKIQIGTKDYSATEAMRECKVPVIFIHGTDDRFVPIEMTYKNYKACAAPKRLLVVPGAEHGMSYLVDKESYEKASKDFWKDFDGYHPESNREEKN
ncbi:MAG: alpha/beta hydrolase [Firmicutes bacterium]|nr:alpha/beta hydrolase [Bacillota bacterium]